MLLSIVAVVIGRTSLTGGYGGYIGAVAGAAAQSSKMPEHHDRDSAAAY